MLRLKRGELYVWLLAWNGEFSFTLNQVDTSLDNVDTRNMRSHIEARSSAANSLLTRASRVAEKSLNTLRIVPILHRKASS
jgi:hypothetical protein